MKVLTPIILALSLILSGCKTASTSVSPVKATEKQDHPSEQDRTEKEKREQNL